MEERLFTLSEEDFLIVQSGDYRAAGPPFFETLLLAGSLRGGGGLGCVVGPPLSAPCCVSGDPRRIRTRLLPFSLLFFFWRNAADNCYFLNISSLFLKKSIGQLDLGKKTAFFYESFFCFVF